MTNVNALHTCILEEYLISLQEMIVVYIPTTHVGYEIIGQHSITKY